MTATSNTNKNLLPIYLRWIVGLTIFNTFVALFMYWISDQRQAFSDTWIFSMAIGYCISGLTILMKRLIWGNEKPRSFYFVLICALCAPVGYVLGYNLASFAHGLEILSVASFFKGSNRVAVMLTMLVSLLAGVFFWNKTKIAEMQAESEKEKAKTAAIERQAMQAQLQLLQAQIEPHMLFNTLANLQGLIALDSEKAQHMLTQFIHYLRASLNSSRTEKTTLKHEFDLLSAYLELLAIRMGKRLSYSTELPHDLERLTIAPMLIQPLVENAIKHGIEPKMDGGTIHVSVQREDKLLHIRVIDTGLGLSTDKSSLPSEQTSGVGNANVRERLLALYGTLASLSLIDNTPHGAIAHLRIPMTENTTD
ncbi:MAG: histidine kinase [Undibacterium sp.]|nr:histidine kinase [Undibacterium sp.]